MSESQRDYSDTLFLPNWTDFPMRAGLPQKEPEILARWHQIGLYQRLREKARGRTKFVLHDGPPYANGNIHIGHALNKILKDVVTRSQQMLGHDSNYVPGWDCHGLPIEWKIEEENYRSKGKPKPDLSDPAAMVAFRRECRAYAERWLNVQREEFKRLGVTGDWDHPYTTMAYPAEAAIAAELMKFAANGTLYRGSKPVMWSVVEKTALAEAEVEYEDYTSDAVWVKFPVKETGHVAAGLADASVVIWTTTPWTIPGNRAISFSSKIAYALYKVTDAAPENWARFGDLFILSDNLAGEVFKQARVTAYDKVMDVPAEVLSQLTASLPAATNSPFRCLTASTSPTTPAPASSIPRRATVARTSRSGWRTRGPWRRAASIPLSPTRSTATASSPTTRRASGRATPAASRSVSSPTRATRVTPTRPSSRR
jgi:isoleucyl-tRNA synthetase